MPKQKTEPYQWPKSGGLLLQWMLRDYIRWLFPQLGAAYIPPEGVKDFTLGEQNASEGEQPQPFRPRSASGPVLKSDLINFKDYVFQAIGIEAAKNPYQLKVRCSLIFVNDLRRLHAHIVFLISKKRQANPTS